MSKHRARSTGLRAVAALVCTGAAAALALAGAGSAQAAIESSLVASPTSVSVQVGGGQDVNVKLDAGCPNALGTGLTYSVAVGTFNSAVVSVSGTSADYHCAASGATFHFTGIACGTTSVRFDPVVSNNGGQNPKGIQNKLGGTTVPVTVTDPLDPNCSNSPPPVGGGRPAAPAVTNAYLRASSAAYNDACKAAFGDKANWHGQLIQKITKWMPKPESVKDDLTQFPTDASWINYVTAQVDIFCGA